MIMRRSLAVSILALVCASGTLRAEDGKRRAGALKGDEVGKGAHQPAPAQPPTTPNAGKTTPRQYNPKELSVDK